MKIILFLILLNLNYMVDAFGTVDISEEREIENVARLAEDLSQMVESSGRVDCETSGMNVDAERAGVDQEVDRRDRPMIRSILRQCLAKRSIRDNVWRDVNTMNRVLCFLPNRYRQVRRYYQIGRSNGVIRLRVPIRFTLTPGQSTENRQRADRKLRQALSCASSFYGRFGLHVSFENVTDPNAPSVLYSETIGRSTTAHVFLGNDRNHNACTMMAHEMGHYLGLPDRYVNTQECPARTGLMPESDLMNGGGSRRPEDVTLNFLDFHTIIAPLCG